jgi:hypothetical protein
MKFLSIVTSQPLAMKMNIVMKFDAMESFTHSYILQVNLLT